MKKWMIVGILVAVLSVFSCQRSFAEGDKIDQVLDTQKDILKELQDIKAELEIIKVRSTK